MKKSILIALISIAAFTANAQTHPGDPKDEKFKAEINSQEKEAVLQVITAAKATLLKSANSNTTEQNLQLIQSLDQVIQLLNERFKGQNIKPVAGGSDAEYSEKARRDIMRGEQ